MSKRIELTYDDKVTIATHKDHKLNDPMVIHEAISELVELVSGQEHSFVVINFEEVEFLSSGFLGGLMDVKKAAEKNGTAIKLCGFSKYIMEAIHIVAFEKKFDIRSNKADAVKAFRLEGA